MERSPAMPGERWATDQSPPSDPSSHPKALSAFWSRGAFPRGTATTAKQLTAEDAVRSGLGSGAA